MRAMSGYAHLQRPSLLAQLPNLFQENPNFAREGLAEIVQISKEDDVQA